MLCRKNDKAAEQQHHRQTAINAAAVNQVRHLCPGARQAIPALQERTVDGEGVGIIDGRCKEHQRQAKQPVRDNRLPQCLEPAHAVERIPAIDAAAQFGRHDAEGRQNAGEQAPGQVAPVRAVPQAGADKHDDDV